MGILNYAIFLINTTCPHLLYYDVQKDELISRRTKNIITILNSKL